MNKKLIIAVLFTIFSANVYAQNTGFKLGYTNLDYILSLLPEAKQIESNLKSYESQLQKQLESKVTEYEKKLQEYQKGLQSGLMTDLVKEDKEKELIGMQNSIKEFEEKAQADMQKKQIALLEPVLDKIQKAIDKVAEENNYDYIFSTHADFGGSAIILYAKNKDNDVSNLVLKELGVTPPTKDSASSTSGSTGTTNTNTDTNSGAPVKKKQ
ncbi:MAG TPA: OmpH family outer membrane protein [Cytophagaceae bacterium]